MSQISPAISRRPRRAVLISGGVIAIAIVAAFAAVRHFRSRSEFVATPEIAIRSLDAKSLYFNAPARPWLLKLRPDLLSADDRDEKSARARDFVQAVQSAKLFRQLDRKYRFDVLLLAGDPSQFRVLVEHLVEAKDWTLAYVDHAAIVFRRGSAAGWKAADLDAIAAGFPGASDRAAFFSQVAVRLLAVRRAEDAKVCLDRAKALDDRLPEVWNGQAIYRMNRGEWTPAMADVGRALAIDADFLPALATKTQVLYSTKKFSEAHALSQRLIEAYPDDPALLFYHAKICHEAHAFTDEIRTLRRLIERAEEESQSASGYRIYLAQAYAKDGKAQPAIDEFNRALADEDLPKEQRSYAEDTLAQIKDRAGLR